MAVVALGSAAGGDVGEAGAGGAIAGATVVVAGGGLVAPYFDPASDARRADSRCAISVRALLTQRCSPWAGTSFT